MVKPVPSSTEQTNQLLLPVAEVSKKINKVSNRSSFHDSSDVHCLYNLSYLYRLSVASDWFGNKYKAVPLEKYSRESRSKLPRISISANKYYSFSSK